MGNDGGSIPTRRELVKEAARNPSAAQVKESQHEQQEYQWTTDPISRQPLVQPVVSDSSGKLYNKATILEYLVEGTRKEDFERETQGAVKSLKTHCILNLRQFRLSDRHQDQHTTSSALPFLLYHFKHIYANN